MEGVKVIENQLQGDSIEKPELARLLEENQAFFGFDEGSVTGFCPSKSEKPFAWNIKAAILSHFQADLKSGSVPSESIEVSY